MAKEEILRRDQVFGKYGKIHKIVFNRSYSSKVSNAEEATVGCYLTYYRTEDATNAIMNIDGSLMEGKHLRASYGTTKYCSYFIRGSTCGNPDCMFLHELAPDSICFMKDEMNLSHKKAKQFQDMIRPQDAKREVMASMPKDKFLQQEGTLYDGADASAEKLGHPLPTVQIHNSSQAAATVVSSSTTAPATAHENRTTSADIPETKPRHPSISRDSIPSQQAPEQPLNLNTHQPEGNARSIRKSPLSGFSGNDPVIPWSDTPATHTKSLYGPIGRAVKECPPSQSSSANRLANPADIWSDVCHERSLHAITIDLWDNHIPSLFPLSSSSNAPKLRSMVSSNQVGNEVGTSSTPSTVSPESSIRPEIKVIEQSQLNNLAQLVGFADCGGTGHIEGDLSAPSVFHAHNHHPHPSVSPSFQTNGILRDEIWRTSPGPILSIGSPCDMINYPSVPPQAANPLTLFGAGPHNSSMASAMPWSTPSNHQISQASSATATSPQYALYSGVAMGAAPPSASYVPQSVALSSGQQTSSTFVNVPATRSTVHEGGRGFYEAPKTLTSTPENLSRHGLQPPNSALQPVNAQTAQRQQTPASQGTQKPESGYVANQPTTVTPNKTASSKAEQSKATPGQASVQQPSRAGAPPSSQKATVTPKAETLSTTKALTSAKRLSMGSYDDSFSGQREQTVLGNSVGSSSEYSAQSKDVKSLQAGSKAVESKRPGDIKNTTEKARSKPEDRENETAKPSDQAKGKGKTNSKDNSKSDPVVRKGSPIVPEQEPEPEILTTEKTVDDLHSSPQAQANENLSPEEQLALEQELERKRIRKLEKKLRLQKEKEEKAKEKEKERLRELELEREREREKELQRQKELEERERKEKERQAQKEREKQRKREIEAEQERLRLEQLKKKELEKKEKERIRQVEKEKREQQLKEQQLKEQQLKEQQLKEQQLKEQLLKEQLLKEQQLKEQRLLEESEANNKQDIEPQHRLILEEKNRFDDDGDDDVPPPDPYTGDSENPDDGFYQMPSPPGETVQDSNWYTFAGSPPNTHRESSSETPTTGRKDNKRAKRRQKQKEKQKQKQQLGTKEHGGDQDLNTTHQLQSSTECAPSQAAQHFFDTMDDYPPLPDEPVSEPDAEDDEDYEDEMHSESIISRITKALMANGAAPDLPSQISFLQHLDVPDETRLLDELLMMVRGAAEGSIPPSVSCLQVLYERLGISLHEDALGTAILGGDEDGDHLYPYSYADPDMETLEDANIAVFLGNKYMGPDDFLTLADSFSSSGSSADLCDDELHLAYSTSTELQLLEEEVMNARKEASMLGGMLLEVISRNAGAPLTTI
eukprot:TRINITY_DN6314_c0_g1_i4.p1 TRINITY_DN6314_c0_g1~~TRINITY_DN6314_c0_g1_i4.p1  ORF type:complete len:1330 (-),score=309.78 TRINITY_DN6314_c0_g1_i4:171-4160(-)